MFDFKGGVDLIKKLIVFAITIVFISGCSVSGLLKDPYKIEPSDYLKSGEYKRRYSSFQSHYHRHNRRYIRGDCSNCHTYYHNKYDKKHRDQGKKIIIVPSNKDTTVIIKNDGW